MPDVSPLLTAEDLSQIFRIHINDVYVLVRDAGLPAYRIGQRRLRFQAAEVTTWLTGQRRPGS